MGLTTRRPFYVAVCAAPLFLLLAGFVCDRSSHTVIFFNSFAQHAIKPRSGACRNLLSIRMNSEATENGHQNGGAQPLKRQPENGSDREESATKRARIDGEQAAAGSSAADNMRPREKVKGVALIKKELSGHSLLPLPSSSH